MILAERIPELSEYPSGFPGYWLSLIFTDKLDSSYVAKALVTNYVRHVESAYSHYRNGRSEALKFINHDGSSIPLYAFLNSSSEFEGCIGNMHRAGQCMRGIVRNLAVPQPIRDLFQPKPAFIQPQIADRIRDLRHSVQHTYEKIAKGHISNDSPFVLAIDGEEVPVPESDQPGQTLKTFDRLRIGSEFITFSDLKSVLAEMGHCAERLAA